MTIAFPDVSNHNGPMALQAATVACLAKATEGTTYRDPYYAHYKSEAGRVGALFGAYHFLREGNGAAQADFCFGIVGPGVPTMIDFEPERDPVTGALISRPTVADAVAFRDRFRQRGGLVRLNYLPRWYWANPVSDGGLGAPSLAPLADLALVSSDYTAYSDTGPGWESYGGLSPQIWQWTDALPYSGQSVDFNAFRGTVDQFRAVLGIAPAQTPPAPIPHQENEMITFQVGKGPNGENPGIWAAVEGIGYVHVPTIQDQGAFLAAGVKQVAVDYTFHQELLAASAKAQVTVDASQLASAVAAAEGDPALLAAQGKAIAHAEAVELHNDTPAN